MSADEDLKLSDLLKYYLRESQAAKVTAVISSDTIGWKSVKSWLRGTLILFSRCAVLCDG